MQYFYVEVSTMTKDQQTKILALCAEGMRYCEIAVQLGMSVNTLKSYCRRHDIHPKTKEELIAAANACPYCGQAIQAHSGRKRRFCSDACRVAWWREHPDQLKPKTTVQRICACCGIPFNCYPTKERLFCSHPCYIQARFGGAHVDERAV